MMYFMKELDERTIRYEAIDSEDPRNDKDSFFYIRTITYDSVRKEVTSIRTATVIEELRGYLMSVIIDKYGYTEISDEEYFYGIKDYYKDYEL